MMVFIYHTALREGQKTCGQPAGTHDKNALFFSILSADVDVPPGASLRRHTAV
jgi:hypothetical protein